MGALLLAVASVALVLPAQPAAAAFSDVGPGHWASSAVTFTALQNPWLRNHGPTYFRPDWALTRKHLARALAMAMVPPEPEPDPEPTESPSPSPSPSPVESTGVEVDPSASPTVEPSVSPSPTPPPPPPLVFKDVSPTDHYYPFISTVVRLGWMTAPGGTFRPDGTLRKWELDLALVNSLGLREEVVGLARTSTADGRSFGKTASWAAMVLAGELRLHYNHPSAYEIRELGPNDVVKRSDAAYALRQAYSANNSWRLYSMRKFRSVVLPAVAPARRQAMEFALRWAGYPYLYGAEWHTATSSGFCCGRQVRGGFDCSGFSWWVLKAPTTGWTPTVVRPYRGWSLPQRTSYDMARNTATRLPFHKLAPMDLMFFKSDLGRTDWPAIDHVGLYLGNGWMIHSSGGRDGVTLSWSGDGWWRDHFVWGRRIIP